MGEHWDPNTVITLADDRSGTLNVSLLEVLCLTRKRFKDKAATAHRLLNAVLNSGGLFILFCWFFHS